MGENAVRKKNVKTFAFSMVSPPHPPRPPLKYGNGGLSSKKCFSWGTNFMGKIFRGIDLNGGTND